MPYKHREFYERGKPEWIPEAPRFAYEVIRLWADLKARVLQMTPPYDITFMLEQDGDVMATARAIHSGVAGVSWSMNGCQFVDQRGDTASDDTALRQLDLALKGLLPCKHCETN